MKTRMRFIPVVIIVVVLGLGAYWLVNRAAAQDQGLKASGTIEATDVTISPEIGGRVEEVLVTDGDAVSQDQPVVRLDDILLQAQLKQVEANIQAAQAQQRAAQAQQHAAQANYDLLKSGPIAEQIQAAQDAVKTAAANVGAAQAQLAQLKAGPREGDIASAEAAVALATQQQKVMQDQYDLDVKCYSFTMPDGQKSSVCPGLGTREEQLRAALNSANENLAAAQARLNQLKSGATKNDINAAQARVDELAGLLEDELDDFVYSTQGESLEQIVGYFLQMRGANIAVAESCTGGMLGERITKVGGSSRYFVGGAIVYDNEMKTLFANVPPMLIAQHGAVSKEVAVAMAEGIREECRATVGVGITGVAGPTGGTEEKPVGLIYVAVSDGKHTEVVERKVPGDRDRIRWWATQQALDMVRRRLM